MTTTTLLRAALSAVLALALAAPAFGQAFDPVTSDPAIDPQAPARLAPYTFKSGDSVLNGRALIAQGKGPHPTVLLLHGQPGNELNMDVAQVLRRAGYNVFMFHYRGSWGSGGEYSYNNVVADTAAALAHVRGLAADANWRVDPARIALVGHSVGGFAALTVGAADPEVKSVASISGFDVGLMGMSAAADNNAKEFWLRLFKGTTSLKISDPEALMTQWFASANEWQFAKLPPKLAKKNVLLVAASKDTISVVPRHHLPLATALKASHGPAFTEVMLDTDHSHSDQRIALSRAVLKWLQAQK
jgi:dipeptidyl aminopeptidase/acylaminoacyl peptidase